MAAQDLAIRLSINADTAEGRAALNAFLKKHIRVGPDGETRLVAINEGRLIDFLPENNQADLPVLPGFDGS